MARKEVKKWIRGNSVILNADPEHAGIAAVAWSIAVEGAEGYPWTSCDIRMSDCNDSICLELSCHTESAFNNSIEKLDRAIREFKKARKALKEGRAHYVWRKENEKKEDKK